MKKIIIAVVLVMIAIAALFFILNKPPKMQTVDFGGMTFKISDQWEKGLLNSGVKIEKDYSLTYNFKDSSIGIEVHYDDEDLYDVEENLCYGYEGSEDSFFTVDGKYAAASYSFPNKDYVHIRTGDRLYVLTFDFQNKEIKDNVKDILDSIEIKKEGENDKK